MATQDELKITRTIGEIKKILEEDTICPELLETAAKIYKSICPEPEPLEGK